MSDKNHRPSLSYEIVGHTAKSLRPTRIAGILFVVAVCLRWYFATQALVLQPVNLPNVRGDAADYYRYAWNLYHHLVFSSDQPGLIKPSPNSFRDPGYPALMSAWMVLTTSFTGWYQGMLISQSLLGAACVPLLILAARRWLSLFWLTVAGLIMACWPHSIAAPAYLLSETLLSFLLAMGLYLASRYDAKNTRWVIALSGLAFSAAALTNSVVAPICLAIPVIGLLTRRLTRMHWLIFATAACLPVLIWSARNAQLPSSTLSSSHRATMNFVEGSWPTYHAAFQSAAAGDPGGQETMTEIEEEIVLSTNDLPAGVHAIFNRVAATPWRYLRWYLAKPALLWGWDIRIGQGDVYVYSTRNSPLLTVPWLRAMSALLRAMNPFVMIAGALGVAIVGAHWRLLPLELIFVAFVCIWPTLVYGLLQSEPRYSTPFRGEEIALACFAVATLSTLTRNIRRSRAPVKTPRATEE